jgi:hypothetical protein
MWKKNSSPKGIHASMETTVQTTYIKSDTALAQVFVLINIQTNKLDVALVYSILDKSVPQLLQRGDE